MTVTAALTSEPDLQFDLHVVRVWHFAFTRHSSGRLKQSFRHRARADAEAFFAAGTNVGGVNKG